MTDLRRQLGVLLDSVKDREVLIDLILALVPRALGRVRYPAPERAAEHAGGSSVEPLVNGSNTGRQPLENDRSLSGSGSESGSHPEPSKPNSGGKEKAGGDFDAFWAAYPRKVAKADARRAWDRRKPPIDLCLAALTWQRETQQWREGYIPHPATWINGGRWEDAKTAPGTPTRPALPLFEKPRPRQPEYQPKPFVPQEEWPEMVEKAKP